MPAYTSFAVAGAGNLGKHIAQSLLEQGFKVSVLSRSKTGATVESLAAAGATIQAVDYADASSVAKAITGSEVVINSLGLEALRNGASEALVAQAKAADVQLYVPNDWGFDYDFTASKGQHTHPLNSKKPLVPEELRKLGLPVLQIFNGPFASFLAMLFSIDKDAGTAKIVGAGETPFGTTAEKDIGSFVGKAFATLSRSELENKTLTVAGSRLTANELIAQVEKRVGKPFKIQRPSDEQTKAQIADLSSEAVFFASFIAWAQLTIDVGGGNQDDDNKRVGFQSSVDVVDVVLGNTSA